MRDGLKPVHRRVLFSMNETGLAPDARPTSKCARIVGEVMGNYHPHGDSAIYDTLVRMAQDFSMRYPLVDGQGNFGSIDDDPAAAMRYTEARLTRLAMEMLRDLDTDTVDFVPNYDGSHAGAARPAGALPEPARQRLLGHRRRHGDEHPAAQPARGHRRRRSPSSRTRRSRSTGLMQPHQGPGLPDRRASSSAARASATPTRPAAAACACRRAPTSSRSAQGKEAIIVTELPFTVKKGGDGGLIQKIADLVHEKKIPDITDLRDESDRNGMRLVIELKRDAIPKVVLNKLYKHTPMQTTFGVNMVALVDGVPRTLSLREVIAAYVAHQREVVVRRTKYELAQKEARAHILEGLLIALDNLDAVIELIRASRDRDSRARRSSWRTSSSRRSRRRRSSTCACRSSRRWSPTRSSTEHADVLERISELREILGDETRVLGIIKEELRRDRRALRRRAAHGDHGEPRTRSTSRT